MQTPPSIEARDVPQRSVALRSKPAEPPVAEQLRRSAPSITDTDWLVLRGMRAAIEELAGRTARRGQVVIDFGCGAQPYAPVFKAHGMIYLGADLDGAPDIAIRSDGTLDAQDRSADLVVSFQVLEHVRDLGTYLREARRVLRENGHLLLSTHGTWLYHPHPEDHRRWTREGLLAELAAHGFANVACVPVVGPLAWTTTIRLTCLAVALRRLGLAGRILARATAMLMNGKAALEDKVTPEWVTRDNACVYVTLSQANDRGVTA